MAGQDVWQLLGSLAKRPSAASLDELCRAVLKSSGAERVFLLVETNEEEHWLAYDFDGMPLERVRERLPVDLLPKPSCQFARRVGESSGIGARLETAEGCVALILEHRFSARALLHLAERDLREWLIAALLATRVHSQSQAHSAPKTVPPRERSAEASPSSRAPTAGESYPVKAGRVPESRPPRRAPLKSMAEFEATAQALRASGWNISRAARTLGMTRHGLKKRMRRLELSRNTPP